MGDSRIFCQNCGFELDNESKICKRCNLVAARNLENFLYCKYKLFTIIGIFGALSVYLSNTASNHNTNYLFLQYGSYISLAIVILLSLNVGWDILFYSSKILQFRFDEEYHYRDWLLLGIRFSLMLLFTAFFVSVITFISAYILSQTTLLSSLTISIGLDFLILIIITFIYFPLRSLIESAGVIFRIILNFLLILSIFLTIRLYFLSHTNDIFGLFMPIFFISILYVLAIRCSWLILQSMDTGIKSITNENFKKKMGQLWIF